jgi:hypothetical protein
VGKKLLEIDFVVETQAREIYFVEGTQAVEIYFG